MNTKKANRDEVRKNSVTFLANKKEKEELQKAADEMGVSNSTFMRIVLKDFLKKSQQ